MRALFSPVIKAIFGETADTIDFKQIIQTGGALIVNLRKTEFLSAEQRNTIGLMIIHQLYAAAELTPRAERKDFYLLVDEARLFLGQDLIDSLDQARKLRFGVLIAGQHLMQFRRGELDMIPSILENCNTMICFQQKNPESLEIWKKYFGYTVLNFEELYQVMDRPDGYDVEIVPEHSHGKSSQISAGIAGSVGGSHTKSVQQSLQVSNQTSRSNTESEGESFQHVDVRGGTRGESAGESRRLFADDESPTISRQASTGNHVGQSDGVTQSKSVARSDAESKSVTRGLTGGTSDGASWQTSGNFGASEGTSHTVSHKHHYTPRTREEHHPSGRLRHSAEDQFHAVAKLVRMMQRQHAIVSVFERPQAFVARVADVAPAFSDPREMEQKLSEFKKKIYALHPYYKTPAMTRAEEDRRIEDFLKAACASVSNQIPQASNEDERQLDDQENENPYGDA